MSSDAPQQPPVASVGQPSPSDRVAGPAIGLIVTAILGLLVQAGALLRNLASLGAGAVQAPEAASQWAALIAGPVAIAINLVGIAIGVVILLGALKMKRLEAYGFALAAAILAMIPCLSPCCLLGLPIGVWALIVLTNPAVKAAFK